MEYHTIDPDAVRDVTWPWATFLADRGTEIDTATVAADIPANVTMHTALDVTTTDVTARISVSGPVRLTCHIVCVNGEQEDWTLVFTPEER